MSVNPKKWNYIENIKVIDDLEYSIIDTVCDNSENPNLNEQITNNDIIIDISSSISDISDTSILATFDNSISNSVESRNEQCQYNKECKQHKQPEKRIYRQYEPQTNNVVFFAKSNKNKSYRNKIEYKKKYNTLDCIDIILNTLIEILFGMVMGLILCLTIYVLYFCC